MNKYELFDWIGITLFLIIAFCMSFLYILTFSSIPQNISLLLGFITTVVLFYLMENYAEQF